MEDVQDVQVIFQFEEGGYDNSFILGTSDMKMNEVISKFKNKVHDLFTNYAKKLFWIILI